MDHFAGLDVSVKETSVCIVDDTGRLVREVKVERMMMRFTLLLFMVLLSGTGRLAAQEKVEARDITPVIKLDEVIFGRRPQFQQDNYTSAPDRGEINLV